MFNRFAVKLVPDLGIPTINIIFFSIYFGIINSFFPILPLLKSDFLEIILACCDRKLDEIDIEWFDKKSLCVVLCSKGYPDTYEKNIEILGLNKLNLENDSFIFHAGTTIKNDKTIVNGGRVLNFVSISDDYLTSRNTIIDKIEKLNWSGGFYRSDIGFKIIK